MKHGSLVNMLYSNAKPIVPQVGMGATVLCWTDRLAGTIIYITGPNVYVRLDKATRLDDRGMSESQTYRYDTDPHGQLVRFAPVRRGKAKGQYREEGRKDGRAVIFGRRDHYHDFSF